jgi:hypothetical protein
MRKEAKTLRDNLKNINRFANKLGYQTKCINIVVENNNCCLFAAL